MFKLKFLKNQRFLKKISCILPETDNNCGCKYICKYYLNFLYLKSFH